MLFDYLSMTMIGSLHLLHLVSINMLLNSAVHSSVNDGQVKVGPKGKSRVYHGDTLSILSVLFFGRTINKISNVSQ